MKRLALLEPGTRVDRYVVLDVLGQGGMAVVYRVRHESLNSLHALKVVGVPSRNIMLRLLQEGRAQARVRHRNIVAVNDVIEVDGSPGLVMEYVKGPSLDALIRHVRLDLPTADRVGRALLRGVQAAHEAGLIHRDLKPANVLVSLEDDGLVPKIADFGLVKEAGGQSDTRTGSMMGTPNYMSPEQIRDTKSVDHRTDLFALGAILYEILTQQLAFSGDDLLDIFNRIARGDRVPIAQLRPDVPARMAEAIDAALEVDRERRPASCARLLELWCGEVPDQQIPSFRLPEDTIEWIRSRTLIPTSSDPTPVGGDPTAVPDTGSASPDTTPPDTMAGWMSDQEVVAAPPPATVPTTSPPSLHRTAGFALGLGGVGLLSAAALLVLGLVVVGWWFLTRPAPLAVVAPVPEPLVAPTPISAPAPVPVPVPVVTPVPAPMPGPTPNPTPTPTPAPIPRPTPVLAAPVPAAPVPTAPIPAPPTPVVAPSPMPVVAPAPPATASVSRSGDATQVLLRDAQGAAVVPGPSVPAGTYSVYATFPGGTEPVRAMTGLVLSGGDRVSLQCVSAFRKCQVVP